MRSPPNTWGGPLPLRDGRMEAFHLQAGEAQILLIRERQNVRESWATTLDAILLALTPASSSGQGRYLHPENSTPKRVWGLSFGWRAS